MMQINYENSMFRFLIPHSEQYNNQIDTVIRKEIGKVGLAETVE